MVPFKVTTHALKCVDKAGGLDNYLLLTKDLKSSDGERAKARVVEVLEARELAREKLNAPTE
jgi:ribosomal protein L28